jgi:hypothetical protein
MLSKEGAVEHLMLVHVTFVQLIKSSASNYYYCYSAQDESPSNPDCSFAVLALVLYINRVYFYL